MVSYDGTLGLQMRAVDVAVDRTTAWGVGVAPSSLVEVDLTEPARPVVKKRPPLDAPPHRGRGQHGLGPRRDRGRRARRPGPLNGGGGLTARAASRLYRSGELPGPVGRHSVRPRGAPRTLPEATLYHPEERLVPLRWPLCAAPTCVCST